MRLFLRGLLLNLVVGGLAHAQSPTIDPAFALGKVYAPGYVPQAVQQADGKRVLVGSFSRVAGTDVAVTGTYSLARLLAGGTQLDVAFQANVAGLQGELSQVLPLANGQLLVLGYGRANPLQSGSISRTGLLRLNTDGTPDAAFTPSTVAPTLIPQAVAEQADGKLVVAGFLEAANGTLSRALVRLNPDGSRDPGFQVSLSNGPSDVVENVLLQPDGNIILSGIFSTVQGQARRALARLLPTGALDPSFDAALPANTRAGRLALQPDGKLLVLLGPNGILALRRLLPTGAADATWQPGTGFSAPGVVLNFGALAVQADGNILVATSATLYNGTPIGRLVRLLPGGTLDASFANQTAAPVAERYPLSLQPLPGGQVLVAGFPLPYGDPAARRVPLAVLGSGGAYLPAAAPAVQQPGTVFDVARQPNGQLLVGGDFTEINGQAAGYVARLNPDGTPDPTFAGACNDAVRSVVLQADGKVLLGGRFGYVGSAGRAGLARLLPTGVLDGAFAPPLVPPAQPFSGGQEVQQVAVQPDGNVLLAGSFNLRPSPTAPPQVLARVLGTTGQRDATFVPADSTGNFTLLVQPNGRILVGGQSRALRPNGTTSVLVWRLLPSGALDASFALTSVSAAGNSNNYTALATDAAGRVYVGNRFPAFGAAPTHDVACLLADGTPDATFVANLTGTQYGVTALAVQPNGRVLAGVELLRGTAYRGLVRLLVDGTEDVGFDAARAPGEDVLRLLIQPDGAILAAGSFQQVSGLPVNGLVRLLDANVLAVRASQSAARLDAWPVPAHGALHLRLDVTAQPHQVQLLDAIGRVALTQNVTQPELTLNTTGIPAGIYLVRVAYAHSFATRRVVLE
ncbi:putative delta-60 repeat protein [Hymenobacter sp. UYAg731]